MFITTNSLAGSLYGFFQSDHLNAADHVAGRVLPFSEQQAGGSIGGPIVRDRAHYFTTYEYERQPNTVVFQPPGYAHNFAVPTRRARHSLLARGDYQISDKHRLMVRYTSSRDNSPFWYDQVGGLGCARLVFENFLNRLSCEAGSFAARSAVQSASAS